MKIQTRTDRQLRTEKRLEIIETGNQNENGLSDWFPLPQNYDL